MDLLILAIGRFGGVALTLVALAVLVVLVGFNAAAENRDDEVPLSWLLAAVTLAICGVVLTCATM